METGSRAESVVGCFRLSEALRVLNASLPTGPRSHHGSVWFKESRSRKLRSRDFVAPREALQALFSQGQVHENIIDGVTHLKAPGVPPIQSCKQTEAGLVVQLERPAVFQQVLTHIPYYLKSSSSSSGQNVILNCVPLHGCRSPESLRLSHLRTILIADHLAAVLRAEGVKVHLVPVLHDEEIKHFLRRLKIDWPADVASSVPDTILSLKQNLLECIYAEDIEAEMGPQQDQKMLKTNAFCRVRLKEFMEKHQNLEGYDPNLDVFPVLEGNLRHLAELQRAVAEHTSTTESCRVIHVVTCEEEFQQQKMDLLWRMVDTGLHTASQKHLVCGPVKVLSCVSPVDASHYFQLRRSQMHKASVMKYGDLVQGSSWDEIIGILTSAAIRFEMLATAHRSQINISMEDAAISTKGTKGGAFMMYNCARLATLFESYHSAVHQGLYAAFPPISELNFSSLQEEGEWLLLFNYIIPFSEVLSQSAQILMSSKGIRITANTEVICKFLVNLSMDFSSYYNRVHILGESLPHLFNQMFARLQLMKAVQEVFHSALATLHIPPLNQI
ncbi:DALR anticodon-binding domain-containing protein 3 [Microcaecilia unicolor]|uniref:DALR anticodon-binding domain-containing protein 3 n=1 Tax=Microcaecilia unicolor TaxID=1415580 RepID=A0A6P7YB29_9AMPH|nr:DALR anticodon-binding domain-containing protein 3 [Microcaecilia unicolor]